MGLTGISSQAGSSVRQRCMKNLTLISTAIQHYDMKTLKGEVKREAHVRIYEGLDANQ